ncbi:hypothetical protein Q4485_09830 [Granulosicoccaceae sp. 1_MG-2023]|nr:hypothetical protein [Granulosicoccaceae sp. 1_MG-2023]
MIVLHVGAGKCGSSALQRFLSNNPVVELSGGQHMYYHVLTAKGAYSGADVKARAESVVHNYWSSQNFGRICDVDFSTFFKGLSKDDVHVFSAEGWINEVSHSTIRQFLSGLNQKVKIVMYVRPQVPLMNSAYWQWGAWSDEEPRQWIMNRAKNAAKWFRKYKAFSSLDEVDECSVRILNGDIVSDFVSLFDENEFSLIKENTSSNKSLSGELLRVLQRNRHLRPGIHASSIDFILEKYFSGIGGPTPWVIDDELFEYIIEECSEDNKKLLRVLDEDQADLMQADERWWKVFSVPFEVESPDAIVAKDFENEKLLVRALEVLIENERK